MKKETKKDSKKWRTFAHRAGRMKVNRYEWVIRLANDIFGYSKFKSSY